MAGSRRASAPAGSRPRSRRSTASPSAPASRSARDDRAGPALYVAGVAVAAGARRRGVGAAISSWLVAGGLEAGARLVHLHADSDPAARVYARLGFAEAPGLDVYVGL